jgi:hypothetical protein
MFIIFFFIIYNSLQYVNYKKQNFIQFQMHSYKYDFIIGRGMKTRSTVKF